MSEEKCGHTKNDGEECTFPVKYVDGKCGFHTDVDEEIETESRGRGRPTKLSYERQESIASEIEEGTPLVAACRLNDITYKTHSNWFQKGEEHYNNNEESEYRDYFQRLARALGYDQSDKTAILWETAERKGDTATMLTILKQRYPETWQDQDIGEARSLNVMLPENAAKK